LIELTEASEKHMFLQPTLIFPRFTFMFRFRPLSQETLWSHNPSLVV